MPKLHFKKVSRTYQCDMAGCRNRTNLLWSKRGDISSRPMHICNDCIKEMYYEIMETVPFDKIEDTFAMPEVPSLAPDGGAEFNGGLSAVIAEPEEEIETITLPPKPEPKPEEPKKTADKPRRTPKTASKAKTGGKA